jgi:hypothetical protein
MVAMLTLKSAGCAAGAAPGIETATPTLAADSSNPGLDPAAGKQQVRAARVRLTTSIATLTNAGILKSGTNAVNAAVIQVPIRCSCCHECSKAGL